MSLNCNYIVSELNTSQDQQSSGKGPEVQDVIIGVRSVRNIRVNIVDNL